MFRTRAASFRTCSVGLLSRLSRDMQLNIPGRLTQPFLVRFRDHGNCRSSPGCFVSRSASNSTAARASLSRGSSTQLITKSELHHSATSFRNTIFSNTAISSPAPQAGFECLRVPTCPYNNLPSGKRLESHSTRHNLTGFFANSAAAARASHSTNAVRRLLTCCFALELSSSPPASRYLADSPRSSILLRARSHCDASTPPMTNPEAITNPEATTNPEVMTNPEATTNPEVKTNPEAEMRHITNFKITPFSADNEQAQHPAQPDLALIILNFDLPPFTQYLWEQAGALRICADGGANRLYDCMPLAHPSEDPEAVRSRYLPDVIRGDLDSIRPEVQSYYESKGCLIVNESEDQDSTDLHKCVQHLVDHCLRPHNPSENATPSTALSGSDSAGQAQSDDTQSNLEVVVVGGLGGRVDHEFGNINVLHRFATLRIVLLSQYCTLRLLPTGSPHRIRPSLDFEGPHCGLIPVYEQSRGTTTTGLRWNLNSLPMSFGTLVSTSNQLISDEVTVSSDVPLLWTTEVRV